MNENKKVDDAKPDSPLFTQLALRFNAASASSDVKGIAQMSVVDSTYLEIESNGKSATVSMWGRKKKKCPVIAQRWLNKFSSQVEERLFRW